MSKDDLTDLINNDEFGLLDIETKQPVATPEDRLRQSFTDINLFYEKSGREPKEGGDVNEHRLAARLKHIRSNEENISKLKSFDKFNLLDSNNKDNTEVDEFNDEFGLLDFEDESILNIQHVPKGGSRNVGAVAKRKVCKDFEKFEPLFNKVHLDIENNIVNLVPFTDSSQLRRGSFFVLGGMVGYIFEMEELKKDAYRSYDGRLHCVFDNGTESNMLYRSLIKLMQAEKTSRIVNYDQKEIKFEDTDVKSGYIYVLRSLSEDPEISSIKNLYKIGYSENKVGDRIKDAANDPTYLMAPVKVVIIFECFNMNTQKLERLIHRFFSDVKLNIDITDKKGDRYTPKEWFIAPFRVIEEFVEKIQDGTIVSYEYDKENESIVKKKDAK